MPRSVAQRKRRIIVRRGERTRRHCARTASPNCWLGDGELPNRLGELEGAKKPAKGAAGADARRSRRPWPVSISGRTCDWPPRCTTLRLSPSRCAPTCANSPTSCPRATTPRGRRRRRRPASAHSTTGSSGSRPRPPTAGGASASGRLRREHRRARTHFGRGRHRGCQPAARVQRLPRPACASDPARRERKDADASHGGSSCVHRNCCAPGSMSRVMRPYRGRARRPCAAPRPQPRRAPAALLRSARSSGVPRRATGPQLGAKVSA